jgi:hypothetical protein
MRENNAHRGHHTMLQFTQAPKLRGAACAKARLSARSVGTCVSGEQISLIVVNDLFAKDKSYAEGHASLHLTFDGDM